MIFLLTGATLSAQEVLTPEDAVAFAVNKNFDIVIAKNEADIARINNNKGAAGMLPKINVTTGDVFNLNNINQKFNTGSEVKKNWVTVNAFNAAANLNWTVFDGMKMFATKERLSALQSQSEIKLKEQMQNTVAQVLGQYYQVVLQKQQIKALNESAGYSEERVKLSQKKFDVGYSDKTPLLQAQVDYASQQGAILKQQALLQEAKAKLNQLMGRDPSTDFEVLDTITITDVPEMKVYRDTATLKNYSILAAQKDIDIAKLEKKEINSQRLPSINFGAGYSFNQNNSKAGLQLFNRSYGPVLGLNATIPIYNGGVFKKQLQASAVNIATKEILVDQLKNDLDTRVTMAYRDYEFARKVLEIDEANVKTASENVAITLDRFRLSQANSLDMRQAQVSYEDALFEVIQARYNAKVAEIELRRLINDLVK